MNRTHGKLQIVGLLILLSLCVPVPAQGWDVRKSSKSKSRAAATAPAVLWREPTDIEFRDLRYGPGSPKLMPKGRLTFVKEELDGLNPKFDVRDQAGVLWRVKPGAEARAETAATRLLWAVGYFADEDYYLPEIRVAKMPKKLQRGQKFVSKGGVLKGVRLERRPEGRKKIGTWNWSKNPFVGTRELNGLRVMMALMNNWDIKDRNNAIYLEGGERHFVVSDMGSTFGRYGNNFRRSSKDNLRQYSRSEFLRNTGRGGVDFHLASSPHPRNTAIYPRWPRWIELRKEMQGVVRNIPREDARWIGGLLSRLSSEQLRDCFRAAGYSPEAVEGFTQVVQERIQTLNQL